MAKTKEQKREIIDKLRDKISREKSMIFVDFKGLKIKALSELRKKLKSVDCQLVVVKKKLMNLVFKEKGIDIDFGKKAEQLAVIFSFSDELSSAKITYQFSQENENLKILGGFFEGEVRQKEEIIFLANIPSREDLLAKMISSLSSPLYNFFNVLEANIKGLINVLINIKT